MILLHKFVMPWMNVHLSRKHLTLQKKIIMDDTTYECDLYSRPKCMIGMISKQKCKSKLTGNDGTRILEDSMRYFHAPTIIIISKGAS